MHARRRWLLAGGAIAAVAVALVVHARVRRDEDAGKPTANDVIAATFAALSRGDVDALMELADPVALFALAIDCDVDAGDGGRDAAGDREAAEERRHDIDARDPRKVRDRARIDYAPRAASAKGLAIEVVRTRDEIGRVGKGDRMMAGCVARTDLRFHRVAVDLRVRDGAGPPRDQVVSMGLAEVGGRWFLATPPAIRR
jgi:hypothetical protein